MTSSKIPPSGEQYEIAHGPYRAVVTESGAALRELTHDGRPLIAGFAADAMASAGRGQVLMPWPNRIRDGRYTFGDVTHQLALTEPKRSNASHGLVRWATWTLLEHTESTVRLSCRVMAQTGYPWTVDMTIEYALGADGLTVTQSATNLADSVAPFASGAHPYLTLGEGSADEWELRLPAASMSMSDERLLPTETVPVEGTTYDYREARPLGDTEFNHALTDLARDADGRAWSSLRHPDTLEQVRLWVDERHPWVLVYTLDDVAGSERSAVAVEPMSANADAFNTGEDLVVLSPAGEDGHTWRGQWGIDAGGQN